MTKKAQKNKGGRPSDFNPLYCQQLIDHMSDGLSFESFGGVVKKSRSGIYKWKDLHPAFKEAAEIGAACSQLFWEKKGIEGNETIKTDDGMTVTRSIPPAIYIFTMKNRFGWRDVQEQKLTANVTTEDKTAREVKELTGVLVELMKEEG